MKANGRRTAWNGGGFVPNGVARRVGNVRTLRANRARWSAKDPVTAARLFVGFSVGDTPTYDLDDLVRLVREVRAGQTGDPSSTFVAQRGIYMHDDGQHIVDESGAQVIILNLGDETDEQFRDQMVRLGEIIAREMQQEEVVVEMQKGGVQQEIIGVGA